MELWLPRPKPESHKGQNGVLLIIGGSRTYHGAPILAALAAVRFCDLVYFHSTSQNMQLMRRMKEATPNAICVPRQKLDWAFGHADCVLIGNGMDVGEKTKAEVSWVLKSGKKCVIDAAGLRCLEAKLLHSKAVLTPHKKEFESAFGEPASKKSAEAVSKKYGCAILLKGKEDVLAWRGKSILVPGGNAGMTKGGTGDVLAGLLAALYSHPSCPSPQHAAYAASVLNKKAADMLYQAVRYNYSSEDLAGELPYAAAGFYKR
ncbi:MAG: NAD(P)H-hydrate dehydratase [Candidatus Micrarchaeota archaeon]|nr:NAD(P)H-hydrate dehydratase [Candidatus Micrarchaeota archaeon]